MQYNYLFFDLLFVVSAIVLFVYFVNINIWLAVPIGGLILALGIDKDRIRNLEYKLKN